MARRRPRDHAFRSGKQLEEDLALAVRYVVWSTSKLEALDHPARIAEKERTTLGASPAEEDRRHISVIDENTPEGFFDPRIVRIEVRDGQTVATQCDIVIAIPVLKGHFEQFILRQCRPMLGTFSVDGRQWRNSKAHSVRRVTGKRTERWRPII
jgi:hypothetical protein